MDSGGNVTLTSSFTFGDQLFTSQSDLLTDVDVSNTDVILYYELFDNLYESVFQKINPSDQIKRNLQISFTHKIIELITNEDLKDGIKSKALSIKQKINKISYRKSKSSNSDIVKDHFNYIVFLTNDKD